MHARVKRVPLRFFATRIKKLLKVYKHTRSSLDVNEKSEEREKEKEEKKAPLSILKKNAKIHKDAKSREQTDRRQKKERKKKKGSYDVLE